MHKWYKLPRRCATLQITSNRWISPGNFNCSTAQLSLVFFHAFPYSPGELLPQRPQPKHCVFFLRALRQDHLGRPSVRRDRQFAKPAKSAKAAGHNADVFFWATPKLPWREDVVKCFPRLFKKALRFEMMFRKKYEEEQCLIWRTCIPISSPTSTLCRETSHGALTHDAVSGCICRADTRTKQNLKRKTQ